MNNKLELVHCGCGGEAEIFHIAPDEGYEGSYCVRCSKCLTQTPFFNKDKNKAIEVWNKAMGAEKNSIVSVFSSEPIAKDINVLNKERTAKVVEVEKPNVFKCAQCGQYFHRTSWGSNVEYCSRCGARLDWRENE